ncbi:FANCM protein, partial [Pomatostomus ruficeps]|nr:FANCM protein [Pomatostomus ruficeps]
PGSVSPQIPEQDTTYAEDSFCVGDEEEEAASGPGEEEEQEVSVNFELLASTSEGFGSSSRRYQTRRRTRLRGSPPVPAHRKKPSRIIVLSDSSEEEPGAGGENPPGTGQGEGQLPEASAQRRNTAGTAPRDGEDTERLRGRECSVSGVLDVPAEQPGRSAPEPPAGAGCRNADLPDLPAAAGVHNWKKPRGSSAAPACPSAGVSVCPAGPGAPCVLANSREVSSGPEVISCLRAEHGLRVQVCSLGSGDYVLGSRLAVDRVQRSELLSPGNREKLRQRLQRLQGAFDRVCLLVETDRVRPG